MAILNISDLRPKVTSRVQDTANKLSLTPTTGDVDLCISSAVEEYSKIRPQKATARLTGNGTNRYAVSVLTNPTAAWDDELSAITRLVYPYVATDIQINDMESDEWAVQQLDTGSIIVFATIVPAPTEQFLLSFTAQHVVTMSAFTPQQSDVEALADLGAEKCCKKLAQVYAESSRAAIGADAVNYISKADGYRKQAIEWRKEFRSKMYGDPEASVGPALAVSSVDQFMSNDVDRYHYHTRRLR